HLFHSPFLSSPPRPPPSSTLFPYTTLFRSCNHSRRRVTFFLLVLFLVPPALGALCSGEPARRSGFLRFAVICFFFLAPSLCGATGTTSCCGSRTRFPFSSAAFHVTLPPALSISPARIPASNPFRITS